MCGVGRVLRCAHDPDSASIRVSGSLVTDLSGSGELPAGPGLK